MTGMFDQDGEISSVQDLLKLVEKMVAGAARHAHVRWWFRGQSKSEWLLQPAVYRPTFPATDERERLNIEQHLSQDFRVESAGLRRGDETSAELYFLEQHYRMPTRLLDWTTSPLAALHFVVSENVDSDGFLFVMDAYQLANCQNREGVHFQGIATSQHPVLRSALEPIFSWEGVEVFPSFILPVRPDHVDRRMGIQRSCFTFHVPKRSVLTKAENKTLQLVLVPKGVKASVKDELFRLGIDDFSIFGDLESLARRLKLAYNLL